MALNADPSHHVHQVSNYFELLRLRNPLLLLLRPQTEANTLKE